jgi:soluble lytic murein transglycosylase-like protein
MTAPRMLLPSPIVIRKNNIWFSELVGIIITLMLLASLMTIAIIFFVNESALGRNHQTIMRLQAESAATVEAVATLRDMTAIAVMLNDVTKERLQPQTVAQLTRLIYRSSRTYGYDPALLLAVIHVESVFINTAEGHFKDGTASGALGLMQLKFETAQEVAADLGIPLHRTADLFVPEVNIPIGVAYLTQLIALFHDLKLGILAYNQGPGTIMESLAGKRPLSISYYERVLRTYYKLKKQSLARKDLFG